MSEGNICKHCRYYDSNHNDIRCPNGKFELLTLEESNPELFRKLNEMFSSSTEKTMKRVIADDFRTGKGYWNAQ